MGAPTIEHHRWGVEAKAASASNRLTRKGRLTTSTWQMRGGTRGSRVGGGRVGRGEGARDRDFLEFMERCAIWIVLRVITEWGPSLP